MLLIIGSVCALLGSTLTNQIEPIFVGFLYGVGIAFMISHIIIKCTKNMREYL